jgi:purine catabolism regulator
MTVSLHQLLADADLGLELVAGAAGADRRAPIRWAHISEIPDPTPWLEGGELLLTTGLAVKDDPDLQRRLIAGLDAVACPAVGFGIGIWLDAVPRGLCDEADRRDLPLFTVPYEVPFIAVTRYVARRVFEAQDLGLRRALDLHRRMLAAVTSGGGVDDVLAVTTRAIPGIDAGLFDAFGRPLARRGGREGALDPGRLWAVLPPRPRARVRFVLGDRVVTAAPVRAADEIEAVLAVVSDAELDDGQMLLLEQAVSAVAVALSRGVSARARRRAAVGALLDDARTGRAGTEQLADRLARLGSAGSPRTWRSTTTSPRGSPRGWRRSSSSRQRRRWAPT